MKNIKTKENVELFLYGTPELMIIKDSHLINNTYLQDKTNNKYKILIDNNLTHIMHHEKTNKIDNIKAYKQIGIEHYRIELLDETKEEIENILNKI